MKRIIIFLIRKRLGLHNGDVFIFDNQKSNNIYFFEKDCLRKMERGTFMPAGVSLNWLLDSECKIQNFKSDIGAAVLAANKKYQEHLDCSIRKRRYFE